MGFEAIKTDSCWPSSLNDDQHCSSPPCWTRRSDCSKSWTTRIVHKWLSVRLLRWTEANFGTLWPHSGRSPRPTGMTRPLPTPTGPSSGPIFNTSDNWKSLRNQNVGICVCTFIEESFSFNVKRKLQVFLAGPHRRSFLHLRPQCVSFDWLLPWRINLSKKRAENNPREIQWHH